MDHSYHQRITMDRFTFVSNAQQAQGAGFVSQLSIDSGEGTARYQRFLPSALCLRRPSTPVAYALDQAREWMQHKSLA
nr:hypothetical protein [Comamonas jiangduensis]